MRAYARNSSAAVDLDLDRDQLITEHIDMARRIALRVARRVPDWVRAEDLIGAAMLGLSEAADRFDRTRGDSFIAFAERRIRGQVLDELRAGDPLPRRLRAKSKQLGDAIRRLEAQLGRDPEDQEVADTLGVSLEEYQEQLKALNHVSLVELKPQHIAGQFGSTQSPHESAERAELVRLIRDGLGDLEERDQVLLSLYYDERLTYKEIGEVLEVSESRVCQLHSRAIARLRSAIDACKEQDNG